MSSVVNVSNSTAFSPALIFKYLEPFNKSKGKNLNGLYSYNFSLHTDPRDLQPTGAVNLSMFNKVELECHTHTPILNENAQVLTVCDEEGNIIGINKPSWVIYNYTFTMRLYEEKINILNFQSGNCKLIYTR